VSEREPGSGPAEASGAAAVSAAAAAPSLAGLQLERDRFGRLVVILGGQRYEHVVPVRAFPIAAPDEAISLLGADGHELAWIPRLNALPAPTRELLADELESRDFTPEIRRIRSVAGYVTPCTWHVETDRGDTAFILGSEESIRRLPGGDLLIADSQGIHYLLRNPAGLDAASRRMLDRFL
jgi:hypothetical protein